MSIRMSRRSSWKRNSARALASSVLPVPVGPTNRNTPTGRRGCLRPARAARTASATARTACSCPITRAPRTSSICRRRRPSSSVSRSIGTRHRAATTASISSVPMSATPARAVENDSRSARAQAWSTRSMALSGRRKVGQVADREVDGPGEGRVRDPGAVVPLQPGPCPFEDAQGGRPVRLLDPDHVEAALQRGVLLDVLPVLAGRRRADDAHRGRGPGPA